MPTANSSLDLSKTRWIHLKSPNLPRSSERACGLALLVMQGVNYLRSQGKNGQAATMRIACVNVSPNLIWCRRILQRLARPIECPNCQLRQSWIELGQAEVSTVSFPTEKANASSPNSRWLQQLETFGSTTGTCCLSHIIDPIQNFTRSGM